MSKTNQQVPPLQVPNDLISRFTLESRIRILLWYFNDAYSSEPVFYSREQISEFMAEVSQRKTKYYGPTDTWLYEMLEKYPLKGKDVAVLGSTIPWYEAICIYSEAKTVTTIEYNKLVTDHPNLSIMTVDEYEKDKRKFDAILSISSFEHDGLGRYGDPIDPDGDLEAMKNAMEMLNPGGLLFLAVPVGVDSLVWNAHRIYGEIRFPMLIEGWDLIDSAGFYDGALRVDMGKNNYQPVFVLRKKENHNF